jgi:hypothetical protein
LKKSGFKEKLKENFGDAVLDIVLTLIFFVAGAGLIALFGIEIDYETMDFDLIVLIGLGALAAVGAVIAAVVVLIKRSRRGRAIDEASVTSKENKG